MARLRSTGPTLSPLGQFVTRVVTPRVPWAEKPVPGPPKRFAQGMGATMSLAAVVAAFGFHDTGLAWVFVAMILVAASLESMLGYCLGCKAFALLMRAGIIPESVCESCNNLQPAAGVGRRPSSVPLATTADGLAAAPPYTSIGMRCEVVAIGTELLLGQIVDTNSSWIGEHLALSGIDSHFQTKVGDNLDRIVSALRLALDRSDAVIVCGGLGPTQDDITRSVGRGDGGRVGA